MSEIAPALVRQVSKDVNEEINSVPGLKRQISKDIYEEMESLSGVATNQTTSDNVVNANKPVLRRQVTKELFDETSTCESDIKDPTIPPRDDSSPLPLPLPHNYSHTQHHHSESIPPPHTFSPSLSLSLSLSCFLKMGETKSEKMIQRLCLIPLLIERRVISLSLSLYLPYKPIERLLI